MLGYFDVDIDDNSFSFFSSLRINATFYSSSVFKDFGVGIFDSVFSRIYLEDFSARPPVYLGGPFDR